jgi:hypothetical protein
MLCHVSRVAAVSDRTSSPAAKPATLDEGRSSQPRGAVGGWLNAADDGNGAAAYTRPRAWPSRESEAALTKERQRD